MKYRADLSGIPYPEVSELHQADFNGEHNEVIINNLSNVGDFVWFSDGKRMAILTRTQGSNTINILNVLTGVTEFSLKAQDIGLEDLAMFALSADEKTILIYGLNLKNGHSEAQIVIYSLETQTTLNSFLPDQIIPSGNKNYPIPTILDGTNAGWIGGNRWFLASINTPGGDCYNYALFFFDTHDLQNSFCVPSAGGIIDYPTISPDLTKIGYVTVVGPGEYYVVIGKLTSNILDKLDVREK